MDCFGISILNYKLIPNLGIVKAMMHKKLKCHNI
jgi:hypothetical protein